MAEQSPLVSSSSSSSSFSFSFSPTSSGQPQAQLGGCGGAGSAFSAAPPSSSSFSSSSSQPVSLFPASPAGAAAATIIPGGPGGRGAFLPPPPSSSSAAAPPPKEADSPESPFEVVPDRAAFDREFGAAATAAGGGPPPPLPPLRGEREVLSQIPEDREVGAFPAKARGGPLAAAGLGGGGALGLCRQSSGTAAALEEVSKCVREMHSFTSELLTWDLVERGGTGGVGGDGIDGDGDVTGGDGDIIDGDGDVTAPRDVLSRGAAAVNGLAEGDSSGDSDDTVTEEAAAVTLEPPPGGAGAAAPNGTGGTEVARPPPAAGAGDWEERVTLRALREAGDGPAAAPQPPLGSPPRLAARELLLWRDARKTGVLFGASLLLLLSLATLSAVTVVAHVALALLSVTVSLRLYRGLLQALQKGDEGHPFRTYLELDLTVSPETFRAHATALARRLDRGLRLLRRLFLVEDLVDSLKLAGAMWLLTYVGAVFNGITLLILAELVAFTLPPLYEKYKTQIDHSVGIARSRTKELLGRLQAKLPALAKKKPE